MVLIDGNYKVLALCGWKAEVLILARRRDRFLAKVKDFDLETVGLQVPAG